MHIGCLECHAVIYWNVSLAHTLHLKMNTVNNFIFGVREFTTKQPKEAADNTIEVLLKLNNYLALRRHRFINGDIFRKTIIPLTGETQVVYKPMLLVNDVT